MTRAVHTRPHSFTPAHARERYAALFTGFNLVHFFILVCLLPFLLLRTCARALTLLYKVLKEPVFIVSPVYLPSSSRGGYLSIVCLYK